MSRKKKVDSSHEEEGSLSRREFFKGGIAVAGLGAAAVAAPTAAKAADDMTWDYEVDVLIIGAGCSGLPAAIRARDAGLSVLAIDQNFDPGGKMLHSGAQVSLGGGDPVQLRDIAGGVDKEGFITVPPIHKPEEMTEDVDFLFHDITDWSVLDASAAAPYRFNERDQHHAWANNCSGTRQFLIDNYIRFGRIQGTHPNGAISRARRAVAFLKLGDKTDIKAGTVTREDAGIAGKSTSAFAPRVMGDGSQIAGPDTVTNGAALSRGLEFAAREKGVQFMLNRRMTEIFREQPLAGRVIGIKAEYTPRFDPDTGAQLTSYWTEGNIEETRGTVTIRARRAIMIASGGHSQNPQFRSMFYPAWRDPAYGSSAMALLGPRGQDGSGIIAGMRVGATLSGMQQNLGINLTGHIPARIGTFDSYTDMLPGHPTFSYRGSTGISMGSSAWEHLVAVNQVGKRFVNEMWLGKSYNTPVWPGGANAGSPTSSMEHVQGDPRNADPAWVKQMYNYYPAVHAAIAVNEGSTAPDFYAGPSWAIFDAATIERDGWDIAFPFLNFENGTAFQADTIEELADKILAYRYTRVPLRHLKETIDKWNSFVDGGADPDFARESEAPMHRIDTAPFYAALIAPIWHDSYGGLRMNGKGEVIDMEGHPIPGLYSGGEASGGGNQHGLGRALVHGFIAGNSIVAARP